MRTQQTWRSVNAVIAYTFYTHSNIHCVFVFVEFCHIQDQAKLIKTFSKEAGRLAKETSLTMIELLKCFDAIPILYHEYANVEDSTNETFAVDGNDVETIQYIGGYIVRKLLKKDSMPELEKQFLRQCAIINTESSVCKINGFLVEILVNCESAFRQQTSNQSITLSKLWECLKTNNIRECVQNITGNREISCESRQCVQKIIALYFKIRGHRLAVKIANDKSSRKPSAGSCTLRKSLAQM